MGVNEFDGLAFLAENNLPLTTGLCIYGTSGKDTITGGNGADYIVGFKGSDTISGGAGSV